MHSELITLSNQLQVNVHMWEVQNKKVIILLHGLGSSGISFSEIAELLSKDYKVIALDLPGHGKSSYLNVEHFFSMTSLAEWVMDVVRYYNLQNFHIVGHSLGGYIGLAFASKFYLKSLILLDGGYIRASVLPDHSLEEEITATEHHIQSYQFSSWEEYEQELLNNGLSNKLIKLSMDSMKNNNGKIQLIVNSNVAKYIVKQKFNEPTENTLTGVNSSVLLLRSMLPEEFNPIRQSETNRLKRYLSITVSDVKDTTHDIYWEKPIFISEQINNWILNNEEEK